MTMQTDIDYNTLRWVKQEIDETLGQARHALEDYVDNPEDDTQLRFCFTHVHQVFGTLQMVELYGAALLAEEMEHLIQALLDHKVGQKRDAYEVLMRGILQMPDYLERVQTGLHDDPLILLPLLNDLRAARGENLLSENALFAPDMSSAAPIEIGERQPELADADAAATARKLRHQYQVGLLNWYRDQDPSAALSRIDEVLHQLEQVCTRQELIRLWWVSRGLVEALIDQGLDVTVSLKLLLGQVDREIKRLIDQGEETWAQRPAADLLKNILYYVARSTSEGARVSDVKQRFHLGGALRSDEEIESAREQLGGPNRAMMQTVSEAIREDLASVKDALDLFLRGDDRKIEDLQSLTDVLHRVADTLGMLGMGVPRKVIQEQDHTVRGILDGSIEPSEAKLMEVAGSLLFVESSLAGLVASRAAGGRSIESPEPEASGEEPVVSLPAAEYRQIEDVVMGEVAVTLARAKDAIVSFIDAPWDHVLLQDVPAMFSEVRGALQIVGLEHSASLLGAINNYVSEKLLGENKRPAQEELDALADAITSIEYYLESVGDQRSRRESVLDLTHESVEKLGYPVERPEAFEVPESGEAVVAAPEPETQETPDTEEVTLEAAPSAEETFDAEAEAAEEPVEVEEISMEAPPADEAIAEAGEEIEPALEAVEEPVAGEPETSDEGRTAELEVESPAAEAPEQPAPASSPTLSPMVEDLDDDILGIFIEEAEEELAAIQEALPKWKSEPENHDQLGRIRRAFHTLKGSGRLVGAVDIGEFAWSIENMLNRVLDNTIEVSQPLLALLEDAVETLPGLIEALQGGGESPARAQEIMTNAFALVDAGKAGHAAPEQDLVEEAAEAAAPPGEAPESESQLMDPVLYDIFSKESAGHLAEVHRFADQCRDNEQFCAITDGLVRALHTLHGSARMAGATDIAELGGMLERYVKALMSNEAPLPAEGMAALRDALATIENMLATLNDADAEPAEYGELLEQVRGLFEAEQAKIDERQRQEQTAVQASAAPAEEPVEEYDSELVEVFLEEGSEILDSSEMILQRWSEDLENHQLIAELQRELHTLKGGARMAGIEAIGDLSHAVESLLSDMVEGEAQASQDAIDLLHRVLDRLVVMLHRTQERLRVEAAPELVQALEALRTGAPAEPAAPVVEEPEAEAAPELQPAPATPAEQERPSQVIEFPTAPEPQVVAPAPETRRAAKGSSQEMVRVSADLLDSLVNNAGEASIYRSRLEQQVGAFGFNLVELDQTVARLRDQLRKLEIETEAQILYRYEQEGGVHEGFDPLEMDRYSHLQQLSRALMESVGDIVSIQGLLDNLVRESETLLVQQARVNTDLQEGLMRTRMVPFTGMVPRLRRIVRQTAHELGRQAELHVVGGEGEMDRTVLDRILAPLEHMLRNAVSHGIEAPEQRAQSGKPEVGNITLSLAREGAEVVIRLADDGAGVSLDAIRRKAVERGLMAEGANLTDNDIMQFILESGFSTAQEVTQISGRGVGMDVVNSEIKQLGGSLHIDSVEGRGATFTIRLPFTVAVNQALLVRVGEEAYAIPLTAIEGIVRLGREELEGLQTDPQARYHYAGRDYQVKHLGGLLGAGTGELAANAKLFPVLLVRSGDHRMALQVDVLMGSREIVVKSVGPQISTVRGISGATILGDGRVVLILDVGALIRLSASARLLPEAVQPAAGEKPQASATNVMVVDDSITVRRVTTRLLERNGMHAVTAKDGVDAVAQLQDYLPDIMLLDIEMPRMDGFELATHIRNEPRLRHIPIIMITSRTGEKHRRRAEEIGVDRYLGKPYQESDLLETIQEVLKERHGNT